MLHPYMPVNMTALLHLNAAIGALHLRLAVALEVHVSLEAPGVFVGAATLGTHVPVVAPYRPRMKGMPPFELVPADDRLREVEGVRAVIREVDQIRL
jgi:hypothetical protein